MRNKNYETNPSEPNARFLEAHCGAANFGGGRPFEAASRQDD
jgi:hypothetical protein